ncbi:MAG: DNA polymerase III subunit gamma/tau [Elusimicrobiota bacterium]|jgi:DNA polymerase-3 subunit gamma/tau
MTKKPGYVVLARKYRPQTFADVLGQPAVSVTLCNALTAQRLHHAYLFTGPRGVGKTTMARILAKALNCVKGPTPEPCGECDPCREIAASSCLDVLEMDAASHTGVDNVREVIIDTVALAPSRDRYKVFIIDEAHMLSGAAFNALLKTLEEPPAHVVFVLATTESAKIPGTIASRCQRFKFRPIAVDSLHRHLTGLAAKEKIAVEPEALELLARSAEGSLRDAVSLLDQCRSFTDKAVTADLVREMFGFVPVDILLGLARALAGGDGAALAGWLVKVYEEGVEPSQLLKDLRSGLQGVYLERAGMSEREDKVWSEAMKGLSAESLRFLLERVNKTLEDLRFGDMPRLTLELGLFGCLEAAGDLAVWIKRLEDLEKRLASAQPAAMASAPALGGVPAPAAGGWAAPAPSAPAVGGALPLKQLWPQLVSKVREDKPSLAAALESSRPSAMPDGSWKIFCRRAFDMDMVNRGMAIIEAKLATLSSIKTCLSVVVDDSGLGSDEVSGEGAAQDSGPAPEAAPWQEANESEGKPASGATLSRAEKIFGGTTRFIKKKPS